MPLTEEEKAAILKEAEEKAAAKAAADAAPKKKPEETDAGDGRTKKAVVEQQARDSARLARIEEHLGLDAIVIDDEEEEVAGEKEAGVDDILGLGGDEPEEKPAQKKKGAKK